MIMHEVTMIGTHLLSAFVILIVLLLMNSVLLLVVLELSFLARNDPVRPHEARLELLEVVQVELSYLLVVADGVFGVQA